MEEQLPNQFYAKKVLRNIDQAAFEREVNAQQLANDNENIVHIFKFSKPVGRAPEIILELCDKGNLFQMIERRELGPLCPRVIGFYFRQLCNALGAMSRLGMLHRDLKLDNLFLDKDFNLKVGSASARGEGSVVLPPPRCQVGDFGMAKRLASDQVTATRCGSPEYMAPEILSGQGYGAKVDIWSAGIILAVLIRRQYPFVGFASMENSSFRAFLEPTSPVWAEVTAHMGDPRCTDLLRGMLAADPAARLSIEQVLAHPWVQSLPAPASEAAFIKATMSQREWWRNQLFPSRPRPLPMGTEEPLALPALPVLPDGACVTTRFDLVEVAVDVLQSRLAACLGSLGGRPVAWEETSLQAVLGMPPSGQQQLEVLLRLNLARESPKVIVLRVDRLDGDGFIYGGPFLDLVRQEVAEWLTAPLDDD
ncbi:putative MAP kinase-activated protein kinase 3 [Paratrimastix pyriformis]|uniref:MAP kinase-activated protein kinase 3 n=1 Tax=Paratrimastix pyriformis TaxID=342808 RepID=A0ABQ8UBQ2_9EUKA|nr:putative MAP kinase-activated protein kinase 3 [Paratrimastix pyriformis]